MLAFFSSNQYSVGLITNNGNYKILSLEFLYRSIFNPLWAIVLWFFEKGTKLNNQRHDIMLYKISALLNSPEAITNKAIYDIIYQNENYESLLKNRYKDNKELKDKADLVKDAELIP